MEVELEDILRIVDKYEADHVYGHSDETRRLVGMVLIHLRKRFRDLEKENAAKQART